MSTGLPIANDDGTRLVHVGASFRRSNFDDPAGLTTTQTDTLRIRQRPEAHDSPRFVDTGAVPATEADTVGGEVAIVRGPLSLQAEYITTRTDTTDGTDPEFAGWYGFVSYWLTGEHRNYDRKKGAFKRVKPKSNFIGKDGGGIGGIELAARISKLDLVDTSIAGGEIENLTIGANWHLNPNTRIMANYVHSSLEDRGILTDSENVDIFITRFQVDF